MEWKYNDGGRKECGFRGTAGDCVIRSIAIATGIPYKIIYDDLFKLNTDFINSHSSKIAMKIKLKGVSPRNGTFRKVYQIYLKNLGWTWIPLMKIGTGCKVHLKASELPAGTVICKLSHHLVTVIDGVLHDTHDCSRYETRCVYGYFTKNIN